MPSFYWIKNSLLALSLVFVLGCQEESDETEPIKEGLDAGLYLEGKKLYRTRCQSCHQKDGKGLASLYPPLAQSDYMEKHFDDIACIIRNGLEGTIVVNNNQYENPMVPNPDLTEEDISKIMTYICNAWGNQKGDITREQVKQQLQKCP